MLTCSCGRGFPGTLDGAWDAKLHAEQGGHHLVVVPAARTASPGA